MTLLEWGVGLCIFIHALILFMKEEGQGGFYMRYFQVSNSEGVNSNLGQALFWIRISPGRGSDLGQNVRSSVDLGNILLADLDRSDPTKIKWCEILTYILLVI